MLCCTRKIIVIPFYSCGKVFPTSSGLGRDQLVPESTSSIAAAVSGLLWTSTFKSATKLFHSDFINRCSYIHIQYNYMHKKSRDITALLWCVILSYRIYLNCLPPGQLQSGPHLSKEGHPNVSEPFIQGRKELRIINNCYVQKYQYYCINIKCLLLLTYQTGKMNKKSILPVPCWFCGGGLACQACHQLTHCCRHQQLAHQQHHQTCPIITYISLSPTSLKRELTKLWPD